jgi:hypothetical protein
MKLYLVLTALLLLGCFSNKEITGVYSSIKSPFSLTLREDSTFSYRYKFQFAYEYSEGTWSRIGKNKIILNSYTKSRIIPLQVEENFFNEDKSNSNLLSVDVGMPDKEKSFYRCSVYINDTLYSKKRCDSLSILVNKPISNFLFAINADEVIPNRFIDTLYTEKFSTKKTIGNKLKVTFLYNDSLFNYRVFNNEVVKVSKKGLKFFAAQDNKLHFLPKKK